MLKLFSKYIYLGLLCLLFSSVSQAATINLSAFMDGAQAGTTSSGVGTADLAYDTDTMELNWVIQWGGLTAAPTSAHFHGPAEPGQNGGVQVPFNHMMNPSIGSVVLDATQEAQLLDGLWYINIHTAFAPGGEIRGQVVPIPAAVWLFASGLIGLVALSRRKTI